MNLCSLIGVDLAKEKKKIQKSPNYDPIYLRCLILDFSALSYIDTSGVSSLILLVKEFNKLHIHVFISGCSCKLNIFSPPMNCYSNKMKLFVKVLCTK